MFLLYAVLVGLVVGVLVGGRLAGLATLQFRWAWLAIGGFLAQIVLFSAPVTDRVGDAGPPLYVLSTGAVLVAVIRNIAVPGLPLVVLGAASNLAAIVTNGGYMPASTSAMAAAGRVQATSYSNSAFIEAPVLAPLTDVFALPQWLPFHNVFSVGDVLIGVGVAMAIVVAMRAGRPGAPRKLPRTAATG